MTEKQADVIILDNGKVLVKDTEENKDLKRMLRELTE